MKTTRFLSFFQPGGPALWIVAALLAMPGFAQTGLGLTPMKVEFKAEGGKAYSGTLTVSSSSERKLRVRTEILDFYVDHNQTPQFLPEVPSEQGYSCRSWITVNPMESEVEPHGVLSARYTIRIPQGAGAGSHHCAIGFLTLPTNEEMEGIGVRTAIRVVTTFYAMVGSPAIEGSIAGLSIEQVIAGGKPQWRGVVAMNNAGRMLYRPMGQLEVADAAGKIVETAELSPFPVLPKRTQRFLFPLKANLPPGQYQLRARIDLGTEVQEAATFVEIKSPGNPETAQR